MANSKEAKARIKINKLLEESGWRFEDDKNGKANIQLEAGVKFNELDEDLENAVTSDGRRGAIDFLLLDKDGRALVVVEAKKEAIDPLSAKEQARNYARNAGARFVILSNGNIHYFWDTKHGNPDTISRFPTQNSITQYEKYTPNPAELARTEVNENYIISTQVPAFATDPSFQDESNRVEFLRTNNLKQLRPYQVQAIKALQESANTGNQRFLFEMATGTGKTLISAAVIKLFLKSGNAKRILFLVDRLELEDQAQKAFVHYLGKDFRSVIYKENRDSWANASIVVSTIQTFLAGDRYKKEFSPTDFELVISDEAHRSIGGNSRAVFEYFVGYKLGLTATPKNYLRGFDAEGSDSQREYERRLLIDTYKTFGCEPGNPTFSYDLDQGSKDGYLIKPTLVDARTNITTELLSEEGYAVHTLTESGETIDETFNERHYERKIFNEETNIAMCKALIDNGIYDPVAKQLGVDLFGKTIVFAVSQKHAARLTNILNKIAFEKWPEQYSESNFAMQVSSQVASAQQMTINFANNRLGGQTNNPEGYDSSKTRVAVTVGMMTTGYDCQDLLNIALMRPVFSPTDFVQIKGRGTRKWTFEYNDYENDSIIEQKEKFKFFDFFATCEYFEEDFNYDEKIKLPPIHVTPPTGPGGDGPIGNPPPEPPKGPIDLATTDELATLSETPEGVIMRIDREGFKRAVEEDVLGNEKLKNMWQNGDTEEAEDFAKKEIFDRPKYFLNLDKIKKIFGVDRRITVKEFLQVAFGDKETFEMKDDLLESEWEKFMEVNPVDQAHYAPVKMFFKAYVTDEKVREIVTSRQIGRFSTESSFHFDEYQQLNGYKTIVPQYVRDYAYHLTNL
ncbi:DEAD/DEAH box helicase family protein [Patescibacteria group bacterium]|nr:DEAD/DEAH box helicase family protein [Patescibacteria group bacterium]MBU1891008.1 DEAD/DEAH box helicase family protein [Patescibacteria group bacterium]